MARSLDQHVLISGLWEAISLSMVIPRQQQRNGSLQPCENGSNVPSSPAAENSIPEIFPRIILFKNFSISYLHPIPLQFIPRSLSRKQKSTSMNCVREYNPNWTVKSVISSSTIPSPLPAAIHSVEHVSCAPQIIQHIRYVQHVDLPCSSQHHKTPRQTSSWTP